MSKPVVRQGGEVKPSKAMPGSARKNVSLKKGVPVGTLPLKSGPVTRGGSK